MRVLLGTRCDTATQVLPLSNKLSFPVGFTVKISFCNRKLVQNVFISKDHTYRRSYNDQVVIMYR